MSDLYFIFDDAVCVTVNSVELSVIGWSRSIVSLVHVPTIHICCVLDKDIDKGMIASLLK